jgi:hypothetical protein
MHLKYNLLCVYTVFLLLEVHSPNVCGRILSSPTVSLKVALAKLRQKKSGEYHSCASFLSLWGPAVALFVASFRQHVCLFCRTCKADFVAPLPVQEFLVLLPAHLLGNKSTKKTARLFCFLSTTVIIVVGLRHRGAQPQKRKGNKKRLSIIVTRHSKSHAFRF